MLMRSRTCPTRIFPARRRSCWCRIISAHTSPLRSTRLPRSALCKAVVTYGGLSTTIAMGFRDAPVSPVPSYRRTRFQDGDPNLDKLFAQSFGCNRELRGFCLVQCSAGVLLCSGFVPRSWRQSTFGKHIVLICLDATSKARHEKQILRFHHRYSIGNTSVL